MVIHCRSIPVFCLENPMDIGTWQAMGLQRVDMTEVT